MSAMKNKGAGLTARDQASILQAARIQEKFKR
jgi:hypothetical protein